MRMRTAVLTLLLVTGSLMIPLPSGPAGAAPTEVSGDIVDTVSWSPADSPVHVVGTVTVREGSVLNIMEGTEVLFDEGTGIDVQGGTLLIDGKDFAPVRFLPNSSSPYRGYYQWIYATSITGYPATVSASWAEFSFGVKGIYLDGVQGAVIQDCRFDGNGEAGIYLSQCSGVQVRNCVFNGSDGWGLKAEFSANLSIAGSTFFGCAATSVELSDCEYSSLTSAYVMGDVSGTGVGLQNCQNIQVDGLSVVDAPRGLELVNSGNNTVFMSMFLRNGIGLVLDSSGDNLFRGNNFTDCALPLSFTGGPELVSNFFEASNHVSGYLIHFITEGDLDGVAAGAVVLAGCFGSTVSNITFPNTGGALIVLYGGGCVLQDLLLDRSAGGVVVLGCPGVRLDNVTVTNSTGTGLLMLGTDGATVRGCTFTGCDVGMGLGGRGNVTIRDSILQGNNRDVSTAGEIKATTIDCSVDSIETGDESQVEEEFTLTVTVRDRSPSPVAGADLRILSEGVPRYATAHFGGTDPVSDAAGAFPPLALPGAIHRYNARSDVNTTVEVWDGQNAFEWNPRTIQLRAPTGAAFTATEVGFLSGAVQDPVGDPVEGVELLLDSGINATTGPDGTYLFPPLAPGNYSMNASRPGWEALPVPVVTVTAGETASVNLTLQAGIDSTGELRGTVLDDQGAPLAGAVVAIAGGSVGVSDSGGVFSIPGAPGGWVNFTASKAGYLDGSGRAFVPPGGLSRWANLTLVASAANLTGAISVQVVDAFFGPLQGAQVWLDGNIEVFQVTPPNGTCLFSNVPAGPHRVDASLAGYVGAGQNVSVVAGSVAGLTLVLVLEPSANGSVAGTVRSLTGAAVTGATVVIEELNLSATTDAAGNYSLGPVPAGMYTLTASAPGYGSDSVQGMVVIGDTVTLQDFVLRPGWMFTNQTLGVRVSGEFFGPGHLVIRRAPAPPVLPPGGFDRFFEVTATGFTCMTGLRIEVTGQLFRDSLAGRDLSVYRVRLYTVQSGGWEPGMQWEEVADSGYDGEGGFFWANVSHFSVFGIGFEKSTGGPAGTISIALPAWLSPVAVVAIVLLVGVPIGIIVIRIRQPPSGGGRQQAPAPPRRQSGTNLYP